MELNGHELEFKYVLKINLLHEHINSPKALDFIWTKRCRKDLKKRLEKLEDDFENGFISPEAFYTWKKMINEVL